MKPIDKIARHAARLAGFTDDGNPRAHFDHYGFDGDVSITARAGGKWLKTIIRRGSSMDEAETKARAFYDRVTKAQVAAREQLKQRAEAEARQAAERTRRQREIVRAARIAFGGDPETPLPEHLRARVMDNDDLSHFVGGQPAHVRIVPPAGIDMEDRAALAAKIDHALAAILNP